MTRFLFGYVAMWVLFCGLALVVAVREVRLVWADELAFLLVPWKLVLFVPAILFVTFAGHFTNDETWDVVTGAGMSLLTFTTSAWAMGTGYRVLTGQRPLSWLVVVLAVALFSSSWFYDGYLLLRDGAYTHRWLGNLMLSPIIYVCAGLALNLEVRGRFLGFAFTRADWPRVVSGAVSGWLAAAAVPLVLVAAYVLVAFVGWRIPVGK